MPLINANDMRLSLTKKIIFSSIILLLFFILLELGFRLSAFYNTPELPSKTLELKEMMNLPPKLDNEFRIFVYGGSVVFGIPVPELGFVNQMRYFFDQNHQKTKINIFNFGLCGQSSSAVLKSLMQTIHNHPDMVIVLTGHNEFLVMNTDLQEIVMKAKESSVFISALYNYILNLRLEYYRNKHKKMFFDDKIVEKKISIYNKNVENIIKVAQSNNVSLLLCTVPSNMFWPPIYYKEENLKEKYFNDVQHIVDFLQQDELINAEVLVKKLLEQDQKDATAIYLMGRIYYARGDYKQADAFFMEAKEFDNYRIRALGIFNTIIRTLSCKKGVYLVDVENEFKKNSPHGIIGYELLADNCHPTPSGNYVIATKIIEVIKKNNLIKNDILSVFNFDLDDFLQKAGFIKNKSLVKLEYLLNNARYHILRYDIDREPTLYRCEFAGKYLKEALLNNPSDWAAAANLGTVHFLMGDIAEGMANLKKASTLKKSKLILDDDAVPCLKNILSRLKLSLEKILK